MIIASRDEKDLDGELLKFFDIRVFQKAGAGLEDLRACSEGCASSRLDAERRR